MTGSRYTNGVHYELYREHGYLYRLTRTYAHRTALRGYNCGNAFMWLFPDGTLIIRRGYAWDGASGPAINTLTFVRGSLVHDALYQLLREGLLPMHERKYSDKELRVIVLEDDMWSVRAWWVYHAVRIFGPLFMKTRYKDTK